MSSFTAPPERPDVPARSSPTEDAATSIDDGPPPSADDAIPTSRTIDDGSDNDFKSATEEKDDLPAVGQVWEGGGATSVFAAFKKSSVSNPPAPPQKQQPAVLTGGPIDRNDLPQLTARFISAIEEAFPQIAPFLEGARFTSIDDRGMATLAFYKDHEASPQMLERGNRRENLQTVLSQLLGAPTGIK
ncbi:MAG TPA: hypothetical protein VGB55_16115, partial [Tepidisphaeraceae bacterium]